MPDLDNTVNDISSPRASMTRTRPRDNPQAPMVATSSGGSVVWLHDAKRRPSFPTLKVRHGIPNCIVPKILPSLHPLARPSLPQARTRLHKDQTRHPATPATEVPLGLECAALFENIISLLLPFCDTVKATRHPPSLERGTQ
jgi:hypothetical protein